MNFIIKNFYKTLLLSIIIFLVITVLTMIMGSKIHFGIHMLINFAFVCLYTFSLTFANHVLFQFLDTIFAKDRFAPKRIIVGFVSSFLVSLFVLFLLRFFEDVFIDKISFHDFIYNQNPRDYVVAIIITFFVTLSVYAFHFYKAYNENRYKEQKIIAGTANAKFESLKNQIDPHFLFNSLNVLSSLIEENPDNAQRFTTSLSKVYRYVLEQKDKELISVEEELSFAKTYMNLLKMRFENSLTYEIEIAPSFAITEMKVVPLSLQLLLENTVKHNVVSEQKPLQIRIYIEANYLCIQNDFQKKEVLSDRQGVGLQNIINRYAIITKRKVIIEQTEKTFTVKIPILTKQISVMETKNNYTENTAYYRAKKRVDELKGFYGNLISYCIVIPFLIFINLRYSPQFQWFWFSAGGWGFGLLMHAFKTFGYGTNWEERKIQEIMKKDEVKNQYQ
jgi:sensor histidine kinase YesM